MEDKSIGRYFQASALGSILGALPRSLQNRIVEGFRRGMITLDVDEASQVLDTLASTLKTVCDIKSARLSLYTAGVRDTRIISSIAPGASLKGRSLDCAWLINVSKNILRNANARVRIPMLLRTYVFSKYKDMEDAGREETDAVSLFIALSGAIISIVASSIRRGQNNYELYIVPDTSMDSILNSYSIYTLLHAKDLRSVEAYIRGLVDIENLSFELAVLLSLALYIHDVTTYIAGMPPLTGLYNVFEKFKLISVVTGGSRPIVAWERPLTLTHLFEKLTNKGAIEVMRKLHLCASHALRHSQTINNAGDIVAQCVTALFAYLETESLDPLLVCEANSQRLVDKFSSLCRESDKEACTAERDFASLIRYMIKLI